MLKHRSRLPCASIPRWPAVSGSHLSLRDFLTLLCASVPLWLEARAAAVRSDSRSGEECSVSSSRRPWPRRPSHHGTHMPRSLKR
jgi:hypothetical protein